jgi:hypothetical protein
MLERCNAACTEGSKGGPDAGKAHKCDLQTLPCHVIREEVDPVGKVAGASTTQKANKRQRLARFRKLAAQPDGDRIFRSVAGKTVSLPTLKANRKIQERFSLLAAIPLPPMS